MWIQKPGPIARGLRSLGTSVSPTYQIGQGRPALAEAAMSYTGPALLDQLGQIGIDPGDLSSFVLLHSHFDHVGLAPFVRKLAPGIQLAGSRVTAEVLRREKVLAFIRKGNDAAAHRAGVPLEAQGRPTLAIDEISVDWILGDGDRIELGGLEVEVLEVPGHSPCSLALHLPEISALIISDAAGLMIRPGEHVPFGVQDFELHLKGMRRLAAYEPRIIALGHQGAVTETEAENLFRDAIGEATSFRDEMSGRLVDGEEPAALSERACDRYYRGMVRFLDRRVVLGSMRVMVEQFVGQGIDSS